MRTTPLFLTLLLLACTPIDKMERRGLGIIQKVEAVPVSAMDAPRVQVTTDKTVVFVYNNPRFCIGDELFGYFDQGTLDCVVDCDRHYRGCPR